MDQAAPKNQFVNPMIELDEFFEQAVEVILKEKKATPSIIQRAFGLGYTRSTRILCQMEQLGIIEFMPGSAAGHKLLVTNESWRSDKEKWLSGVFAPASEEDVFEEPIKQETVPKVESGYVLLGILENASNDEIKKAYYQKMKEYHPDKTSGLGDKLKNLALEESKKINQAYDAIKKQKGF